jgi:PAS domain S-box-containing protein
MCCQRYFGNYRPAPDVAGWLLNLAIYTETLPLPFTVSDPSIAGFPLIFVNEKFCEVTGYSKEDSYGRNCRFLQGPGTNPEHGQKLKDDLRDGSVSQTMLLNYRKTGEPFENLLTMRYIHDSLGRRRYCVGLQLDLTGKSSESGPWSQQMLATEEGRKLIAEASQKMLKLITMIPKVFEVSQSQPENVRASGQRSLQALSPQQALWKPQGQQKQQKQPQLPPS